MLRGNLSTRPFYNERLVTAALTAVALGALVFTGFNVTRLVVLSGERRELNAKIARDRTEAAAVLARATALRASVNDATLASLALATREANDLIDARTFSWTAFFGLIERTLPFDVRLVAVSPHVDRGVFKVGMVVLARDLTDIDAFIEALGTTGAFYDVAPTSQTLTADGTYSASIDAAYLPPAAAPESAATTPSKTGEVAAR